MKRTRSQTNASRLAKANSSLKVWKWKRNYNLDFHFIWGSL